MICKPCKKAAKKTRKSRDESPASFWVFPHPEACGCPCQHEPAQEWQKMFSVERPK